MSQNYTPSFKETKQEPLKAELAGEKIWRLDCIAHYWRKLDKEKRYLSMRHFGG